YFVAGEASGDNHGAALMEALRHFQPGLELSGRGGPKMKAIAGDDFLDWSHEAGVVGLWEVVKHYPYFRREFHKTLREIARTNPEAVVLIDYPGFNLRLAQTLHHRSLGGKIIYYISPQVWAWNRGRIPQMARWLDLMLCIFPFEAELYRQSGLRTIFVGHPMIENLAAKRSDARRVRNLVGLFPGSRGREVRKLLPILIEVMHELQRSRPELHFKIAAASEALAAKIRDELQPARRPLGEVEVVVGQTAQVMQESEAGIVASGTATLEAAFFRMPFVLVYKVAILTYLAGRILIAVKHLGMPNVLAGREIVPEFIQGKAQPSAIAAQVLQLLEDDARRAQMRREFETVIAKLGRGGANEAAARAILQLVHYP
ncbi:MAG TPA: lipid-A-disaccharide synthase, partial [Chthoniobacterales bacterium]|nr:lipid-A-disaccharide synthase [Chthoniobacterales bacterium]